jgi:type I restriction enzyme S subunit
MIEGLKPYAEYRESDIPWARAIPSSWQTKRAKRLFTKMQRPVRSEDEVVTCFRDGMVTLRKNRRLRGFTEATVESGYQGIRKGDLVIHGMDAFAGAIGVSDSDGKGTPVYNVCQPGHGVVASYYAHAIREMSRAQWILALAKGIRERSTDFRYEMFGNQFVPLPPPDEQAAIVRFLDHANRKIDGFIRAKRKLIGLLNEQKKAIIQTAISKVSTSDRRTMPVRAVLRPVKRMGHPNKTLLSLFRDYGVIPKNSRENKNVDVRDLALCQLVSPGDVVMNKMKAWQGSIAVSGLEGIVSPDYMVLEFQIKPIVADFFHYALRSPSMVANYRKQAYGVRPGQWRLMYPDFCRLRLPVPSIEEQQAIVDHIRRETRDLNTAVARTEREIALMQEYRTRLTADLVTGKLDVRSAAAKLPATLDDTVAEPASDDPLEDIADEGVEA